MLAVWIALALIVVGGVLFAIGIGWHNLPAFLIGILSLAAATLFGSRGRVPRDGITEHH